MPADNRVCYYLLILILILVCYRYYKKLGDEEKQFIQPRKENLIQKMYTQNYRKHNSNFEISLACLNEGRGEQRNKE